jgi:molecular chaperone DnaK
VVTRAGRFPVTEISGMVLAHLRKIAEAYLQSPVSECVITVPANFNDGQREATRRAAEQAGLTVLRILNEPTSAAVAYGDGKKLHQRVVVFDYGGGTFDVTLLAARDSVYEVIATGGEPFLGGDDMDRSLAEQLAQEFLQRHRVDLRAHPEAMAKLLVASEQIKGQLSSEGRVAGTIKELAHGEGGKALGLEFELKRQRFEEIIAAQVERAIQKCEKVLAEAGVVAAHVDEIIMVGGTTRVPLVRKRVAEHFGREPRTDINPMEVVAAGAALQAAVLSGDASAADGPLLMDVTPHALGVAMAGGYTDLLVDKNARIPTERSRVFSTARDGQTEVRIRVCQGESKMFAQNTPLGELRLDGLPAGPRGQARIEVSFLLDADGILQVSARDAATGRTAQATLRVVGVDPA